METAEQLVEHPETMLKSELLSSLSAMGVINDMTPRTKKQLVDIYNAEKEKRRTETVMTPVQTQKTARSKLAAVSHAEPARTPEPVKPLEHSLKTPVARVAYPRMVIKSAKYGYKGQAGSDEETDDDFPEVPTRSRRTGIVLAVVVAVIAIAAAVAVVGPDTLPSVSLPGLPAIALPSPMEYYRAYQNKKIADRRDACVRRLIHPIVDEVNRLAGRELCSGGDPQPVELADVMAHLPESLTACAGDEVADILDQLKETSGVSVSGTALLASHPHAPLGCRVKSAIATNPLVVAGIGASSALVVVSFVALSRALAHRKAVRGVTDDVLQFLRDYALQMDKINARSITRRALPIIHVRDQLREYRGRLDQGIWDEVVRRVEADSRISHFSATDEHGEYNLCWEWRGAITDRGEVKFSFTSPAMDVGMKEADAQPTPTLYQL
ncbi:Man1-Src1p-C-terminal domain [Carpediemonas membranifera]|uniref:Man1-Src1p-C-terminal domain n=1 Tax=Carpediemonas membranifera TaxID=201153 RepID=A0A8J6AVH2_9EUKA|nr:Man1-Src1p-C-terminal domain [Carpediemonas membranifera]|eukprot:KAG9395218.1 Man1-Src1p-C-terminal domain [Carpediemonas membranifera]